jgi:hypothetical protein
MYLRGRRQTYIATKLGISQQQVSYDIKQLRRRWRESSVVNFNEAAQEQLARIDELERTYWIAWERSTTDTKVGNASFLEGVQWCVEQRCKILGIYEATKISLDWRRAVENQGYDAEVIFDEVVEALVTVLESKNTHNVRRNVTDD